MSDHLATFKTIKVNHPDFRFVYKHGGVNHTGPIVIFERKEWIKPTPEAALDFEVRQTLVESLGGVMRQSYWQIAGKNPVFTQGDINSMLAAVRRDLPEYKIVDKWNGLGCLTMSVAILRRK